MFCPRPSPCNSFDSRINFFIQTVASQMIWYLDDHQDAIRLVTTFTVLLPLAGAIGITPVGMYSRIYC
jgi:hypothetical protein